MRRLYIILVCMLFFCSVTVVFGGEGPDQGSWYPNQPFSVPIEVAYIFVGFMAFMAICYALLKWVFVEDFPIG